MKFVDIIAFYLIRIYLMRFVGYVSCRNVTVSWYLAVLLAEVHNLRSTVHYSENKVVSGRHATLWGQRGHDSIHLPVAPFELSNGPYWQFGLWSWTY